MASKHWLRPREFMVQVVRVSTEPGIDYGACSFFAAPVAGSLQGRTVLVLLQATIASERGHCCTVRHDECKKASASDSWRHEKITLKPTNLAYMPIVREHLEEDAVQAICELLEMLGTDAREKS